MGILIYPCSCSQAFYSQVFSTCESLSSLVIRMPVLLGLIIIMSESEIVPSQTLCGYLKPSWSRCTFSLQEVALGPSWSHIWFFRVPMGQGGSLWDALDLGCRELCDLPCTWALLSLLIQTSIGSKALPCGVTSFLTPHLMDVIKVSSTAQELM